MVEDEGLKSHFQSHAVNEPLASEEKQKEMLINLRSEEKQKEMLKNSRNLESFRQAFAFREVKITSRCYCERR